MEAAKGRHQEGTTTVTTTIDDHEDVWGRVGTVSIVGKVPVLVIVIGEKESRLRMTCSRNDHWWIFDLSLATSCGEKRLTFFLSTNSNSKGVSVVTVFDDCAVRLSVE